MKKTLLILAILVVSPLAFAAAQCVICGMDAGPKSRVRFESVRKEKPAAFCSFTCAHRFHGTKEFRNAPLHAFDYNSGEKISASSAFYLTGGSALEKEIKFGMPPVVVAFKDKKSRDAAKSKFKDSKPVDGFAQLEKLY